MRKRVVVGMTLLVLGLIVASPGLAAPYPQVRSVITYPAEGMTVSGRVEVRGIAIHSNMDFYQLRYAAGSQETAGSQWVDFAIVEDKQVQDNVLGVWDTTTIPDGQYTLALAVWGVNDPSNPWVHFVRNLTVNNAQPVEMPTPVVEQPTPEPLPTAVIGPTPTPVSIEQPPTATPHPSPAAVGEASEEAGTPAEDEEGGFSLALNTNVLRDAFCTGGLITVMLFLLWGLYAMAKAIIRWYLRLRAGPPPWK